MESKKVKSETVNGLTKEQAMDKAYRIAFEGEGLRQACSQATWAGISEALGIKNDLIFKCISGLEGGGACTAKVACGAWSGALVAISYYFGRTYDKWLASEKDLKSSFIGKKLYERFEEKWGSAICPEIHLKLYGRNFDFSKRDDFDIFEGMGAHVSGCTSVCATVAAWTVDLLWDEIPKDLEVDMIPGLGEEIPEGYDLVKATNRKNAGWGFEKEGN